MTPLEKFEEFVENTLGLSVRKLPSGGYQSFGAHCAWEAWQKSREAQVIQLPDQYDPIYQEFFEDVDGGCFNYSKYLNDVRAVLASAGLKVMP